MDKYAVVIHQEPAGGYWAEVPALPGCYSQGETVDEAMENVREAISGVLDVMKAKRHGAGIEHPGSGACCLQPITGPEISFKTGERLIMPVPVNGNRSLKPGLANRIGRAAEIFWWILKRSGRGSENSGRSLGGHSRVKLKVEVS